MTFKLSEDPIQQAERGLARIAKAARISMIIPLPILAFATVGFFHVEAHWYRNPFLALIFGIFVLGQAMVVRQMRGLVVGARNTAKSLVVLTAAGDEPDLGKLRASLLEGAPAGHLRDLLLRWIELGLRGETHGSEALLENAWDRRALQDHKSVSFHISLNRATLKIGFLGTLYGLLITFPPMKNAVLGLADSDGEMKFIRDITAAIAGDELAILVTLGATALSVLIEMVTVQVLERTLGGFDLVNSHINDWNLTRLQPWIRKRYAASAREKTLDLHADLEKKLIDAQGVMDRNLGRTLESMAQTSRQIEMLAQVQVMVGRRVQELVDYEKQYRGFLETKQQTAAPAHLNPGAAPSRAAASPGSHGIPAPGAPAVPARAAPPGGIPANGAAGLNGSHGDAA